MTTAAAPNWPLLSTIERRLLGVLVEKAKTTPDAYPLSLNSLVTGSNQKSNRDPLLNLSDDAVETALEGMQPRGLVTRIQGGRVDRWRHNLYEVWDVEKVELAVLAELLLRGAQTEGELRGRASRMEPIEDLETLRATLKPLVERRLVVYLGPENRRGVQLTHGFHTPQELDYLRRHAPAEEPEPQRTPSPIATAPNVVTPAVPDTRVIQMQEEIAGLRTQMQAMQTALDAVRQQLQTLKESLGG